MANRLRLLLVLVLLAVAIGGSIPSNAGADTPPSPQEQLNSLTQFWSGTTTGNPLSPLLNLGMIGLNDQRLAKAQPNECFKAIGDSIFPWDFSRNPTCPAGYVPKVNDAYTWGLAKVGSRVWWGTGPNIVCLVYSGYLQQTTPVQTDSYVCENTSGLLKTDFRPPHIYYYDLAAKKQVEVTPPAAAGILGIRSAGSIGDLVLLGGPNLKGGLTLLAFKSSDGSYLGAKEYPEYTNIRKWLVINNVLYTGARTVDQRGAILRWTGTLADPFKAPIVVGRIASEPAEFAFHENRLFTATWPGGNFADKPEDQMASVNMSPVIPAGGLTASHAASWKQVWKASDYEPNAVAAATYGGGALASFGGYLYWGTMHVPGVAALAFSDIYYKGRTPTQTEALAAWEGNHRAISIFRGKSFGTTTQKLEVAYGESSLPVYNATTQAWGTAPTKMGAPVFGHSGFGNTYNNYTWTMAVYKNQLFVGTMDFSYLIGDFVQTYVRKATGQPLTGNPPNYPHTYGADLFRFTSPTQDAMPVSLEGLGNYLNYGIRTMVADNSTTYPGLYLGTANPMNLMTDPSKPAGGWEVHQMKSSFFGW